MNKLICVGNLTADPVLLEREYTNKATGEIIKSKVCNFSVACDEGYGESKFTTFFRVSAWHKKAENCAKFLTKGSKVSVIGPVVVDPYISNDGLPKAVMTVRAETVEFCGKNKEEIEESPY